MTQPRTKKNPASSPAKTIGAGSQVDTPKRSRTSVPGMTWPNIERAQARIVILIDRLGLAKDVADPIPIGAADAAALFDVAFAAGEDLSDLLCALRNAGAEV